MKNPFSLLVQQVYTQLGAISKNIKISAAALLLSYKKHLAEEEELIMMGRHDTGCIMYDFCVYMWALREYFCSSIRPHGHNIFWGKRWKVMKHWGIELFSAFKNRMISVLVLGWYFQTKLYLYSFSDNISNQIIFMFVFSGKFFPNIIHICLWLFQKIQIFYAFVFDDFKKSIIISICNRFIENKLIVVAFIFVSGKRSEPKKNCI